ncbi:MAG: DUF4167 domain-containing protein [Holosporales bacterium]|jgi:hypothetical protein|nr:DUF4167 domain-containing protein [Holosporales bacterium]
MRKGNEKGLAYYQNLKTKYLNYAKEASSSGDFVLCEHNLQFAEHYGRVISSKFKSPQMHSQSNDDCQLAFHHSKQQKREEKQDMLAVNAPRKLNNPPEVSPRPKTNRRPPTTSIDPS